MSTGGDKRARMDSLRAYRMRQAGCTNKEIAAVMGWDVKKVPAKIKLGGIIASIDDGACSTAKATDTE